MSTIIPNWYHFMAEKAVTELIIALTTSPPTPLWGGDIALPRVEEVLPSVLRKGSIVKSSLSETAIDRLRACG